MNAICPCVPQVKVTCVIHPAPEMRAYASPITLTICDCDRRDCPVNGCRAKVGPGTGQRCANGHKS